MVLGRGQCGDSGNVVNLASWASEERDELLVHDPKVLPVTVDFGLNGSDPAA